MAKGNELHFFRTFHMQFFAAYRIRRTNFSQCAPKSMQCLENFMNYSTDSRKNNNTRNPGPGPSNAIRQPQCKNCTKTKHIRNCFPFFVNNFYGPQEFSPRGPLEAGRLAGVFQSATS